MNVKKISQNKLEKIKNWCFVDEYLAINKKKENLKKRLLRLKLPTTSFQLFLF